MCFVDLVAVVWQNRYQSTVQNDVIPQDATEHWMLKPDLHRRLIADGHPEKFKDNGYRKFGKKALVLKMHL